MQAEEAEQTQDWATAEKLYAEATFIDTAASLINTALWLGLCRTRWHLQLSDSSVEACDNTLGLQPDNAEAFKYKVRVLPPLQGLAGFAALSGCMGRAFHRCKCHCQCGCQRSTSC